MKKLILVTLLLIGNFTFSQSTYDYDKAEKLQDKLYKDTNLKTGKKFFQDIYGTTAKIGYPDKAPDLLSISLIKSKLKILEEIKTDWNNPIDGDIAIITGYYNDFKNICNDNSSYCKRMDSYHTSKIENAQGYWDKMYFEWNKLLTDKKN